MAVTPTISLSGSGPTTDTDLMAQAGQAITMASAMCDAYTRGQHVKADGITTRPGVDAVVPNGSSANARQPRRSAVLDRRRDVQSGIRGLHPRRAHRPGPLPTQGGLTVPGCHQGTPVTLQDRWRTR